MSKFNNQNPKKIYSYSFSKKTCRQRACRRKTKILFSIHAYVDSRVPQCTHLSSAPCYQQALEFHPCSRKKKESYCFSLRVWDQNFFSHIHRLTELHRIVFTRMLFETSIACKSSFYGSPGSLERALRYSVSVLQVNIQFVPANNLRFYGVWRRNFYI